jgi:hypothetical protein
MGRFSSTEYGIHVVDSGDVNICCDWMGHSQIFTGNSVIIPRVESIDLTQMFRFSWLPNCKDLIYLSISLLVLILSGVSLIFVPNFLHAPDPFSADMLLTMLRQLLAVAGIIIDLAQLTYS